MKSRGNFTSLISSIALGIAFAMPAWAAKDFESGQGKQARAPQNNLYIVRMADAPAVAYDGGIAGLKATRPGKGKKLDPNSPDVVRYTSYLDSRHDDKVAKVGGRKVYSYRYAFNGFAAELSADQAAALAAEPDVLSIQKDEARPVDTATTPAFLGLTAPGGLWSFGNAGKGEGVIVGIVDGGIWPEHPSFSDRTGVNGNGTQDGKLDYQQIPGWHGKCTPGDAFNASHCSQKIIGAQYFNAGWGGDAGIRAQLPWEFNSPRDFGGHGSHTASTAAGNAGVMPEGAAASFGPMSGMAPRARIAVYKVCFQTPAGGSCFNSDSVAAIDTAVADGVDVINFSISGTTTNFRDAVEIAYLYAADAGIFVAASAGNSGPTVGTVAHPSPWLTTVAAGTHNRDGVGSVTLGNGVTYTGGSLATALGSTPVIDSTAAGLPGANPTMVALCYAASDNVVAGVPTPVLDPAKVAGNIVLCDRGVTGRISKSLAVKEAGGVGMILLNVTPGTVNGDYHFVPTVHLQNTDRAAVKTYATTANPTASIAQGTVVLLSGVAPLTASFSSRGPLAAGGGDLLKPDIIAPGQDILAAVAPPGNGGRLFDLYSGTSMSSPHIAGIGAVLKGLRPDWTPAMIKSALMTSAGDILDGPNTNPLVIFRQGAGHVRPNNANTPGLVFNSGFNDWLGFLCGTQLPTSFCTSAGVPVLDASDLNLASIAVGDLTGTQTVKRTVTNVGDSAATYTVSYTGLAGFTVAFSDPSFTLNPRQSKSFTITFTRNSTAPLAPLNAYTGGQITWTAGAQKVRVPVVLRPVALSAPLQASASYNVKFGYAGTFAVAPRGLVAADTVTGSVNGSGGGDFAPTLTDGTITKFDVVVPAGMSYLRFALFDANTDAGSDLDLYVYRGTTLVGVSGNGTSTEEVNFVNPVAATYTVYVHGFGTTGPSANFTLFSWQLGTTGAGNMTATAPAAATVAGTATVTLGFGPLTAGTKYLGSVVYSGTTGTPPVAVTGLPNPTIVRVDP